MSFIKVAMHLEWCGGTRGRPEVGIAQVVPLQDNAIVNPSICLVIMVVKALLGSSFGISLLEVAH